MIQADKNVIKMGFGFFWMMFLCAAICFLQIFNLKLYDVNFSLEERFNQSCYERVNGVLIETDMSKKLNYHFWITLTIMLTCIHTIIAMYAIYSNDQKYQKLGVPLTKRLAVGTVVLKLVLGFALTLNVESCTLMYYNALQFQSVTDFCLLVIAVLAYVFGMFKNVVTPFPSSVIV